MHTYYGKFLRIFHISTYLKIKGLSPAVKFNSSLYINKHERKRSQCLTVALQWSTSSASISVHGGGRIETPGLADYHRGLAYVNWTTCVPNLAHCSLPLSILTNTQLQICERVYVQAISTCLY